MSRSACEPSTRAFAAAVLAAWVAAHAPAQAAAITEERVRDVVSWLAADERRGRDTPSPELQQAADWLAERFAAAGLAQAAQGSWFHAYALPGLRLDSRAIAVTVQCRADKDATTVELKADADVRLWRPADGIGGTEEPATVAPVGDPVLQRLLDAQSGRRPTLLEVPESHSYWLGAGGAREVLGGRRAAARPIFLVREGLLPKPKAEPAWSVTWSAPPAEAVEIPLRNVVGVLRGAELEDEFVVVSAHYDHVGTGRPVDGDAIYNGADDNATGTTAVVLLAEAMAKVPRLRRSVLFVCFSAEEKGLRGSRAFCESPPVPRERIVVDVNIEMIGRPEEGRRNEAWITGVDLSDFGAIAGPALQRAGIALRDFPMASGLFAASDNWSFVRHGIVAHSISAGSLHGDYHKPGDSVEKLDVPHMTQVIRGLYEVVRELAERDAPPQWNDAGRKRMEQARQQTPR
jgi:hypothetical protein